MSERAESGSPRPMRTDAARTASPDATAPIGLGGGARLLPEAMRLLLRHRGLWSLALVPVAIALVLLGAALAILLQYSGALMAMVSGMFPSFEVDAWWHWLWVGPLRALFYVLRHLLFAAAFGAGLLLAWLLAGFAAAPFLDALSARVERIVAGTVPEGESAPGLLGILQEGGRAFRSEMSRLLFFGGLWLVITFGGVVIPGGQIVAPPLLTAVTVFFLPLEYAGFALDRRAVAFRERRDWVRAHKRPMAGFGAAAFLACLVPGLNLVMIPALIVAGTLLVLRMPPPAARISEAPASPPGTAPSP